MSAWEWKSSTQWKEKFSRGEWSNTFIDARSEGVKNVRRRARAIIYGTFGYSSCVFFHSGEYIMEHNLQETIVLLSHTPVALNAFLRDLPDTWTRSSEGNKTWSAYDVIGHLIHGERTDWMPRAKMILELGESRAFETFDRLAQERESKGKSLGELLDEFARLRAENLLELRRMNLSASDLQKKGKHPQLGVVTLSQLLATWAVHDLTHLHQVSRIMAYQYRETVGPWQAYLGVLHCNGHSS
jgi:DinB superfamily